MQYARSRYLSKAIVTKRNGLLCVAGLLSAIAVKCGVAQTPATVSLTHPAPLRVGVDAWPLIDQPATPAALKVNARLTHLNQLMRRTLKDCDAGYNEALKQMGPDAKGQSPASDDTNRTIVVAMQGPRYLSMVARDFADCGGAHPDSDTEVMVFDLTTGSPVNWMALVAKSAKASTYTDTVMDGTTAGALILPALSRVYVAAADKDCKDAFQDPQSFLVWPDAKKGTVDVEAFDLPHVVAACATEMDLRLEQAGKLGFSKGLLDAIHAAHVAGAQ